MLICKMANETSYCKASSNLPEFALTLFLGSVLSPLHSAKRCVKNGVGCFKRDGVHSTGRGVMKEKLRSFVMKCVVTKPPSTKITPFDKKSLLHTYKKRVLQPS